MSEREERRATLRAQELELHAAYMASEIGSQEECTLELALQQTMDELDAIFREELAEWGADDDRLLREKLANAAYGMYR